MALDEDISTLVNNEAQDEEKMTAENDLERVEQEPEPQTSLHIERKMSGEICASVNGKTVGVLISCCFPWTNNRRFISLRDYDGNEVALIDTLEDLDIESRDAVEQALVEAEFVLEVLSVDSLEAEFEINNWKVQTRQGPYTFQTELDVWPRVLPGEGLLFRDIVGNLFFIPKPAELDEKSRKLLWAFID